MTTLIKNIQLIDGTAKPAHKADVLIKNDKISAIGHLGNYHAEEIIDGMNAYLTPGFIDISNASDKYLKIFNSKQQENLLNQGITTIIGGHSGISLAPLFYGTLNVLMPFAAGKKINIDWHEFSEFASSFSERKLGINFGSLIGYGTLYDNIVKEKPPRNLEVNEEKILYQTVGKCLSQGAFGVSFNLDDTCAKISYFELKKIAEIVKKANKICSIYFDKNNEEMTEKVKKAVYLGKETLSHLIINELAPVVGREKEFEQAIQILDDSRTNCNAHFSCAPCRDIIRPIKNFLPNDVSDDIAATAKKKKIMKHLAKIIKTGKITIVSANNNKHLIGTTLREFSHHRNLGLVEGFYELMKITKLQAEMLSSDANEEMILDTLQNEKALVATGNNVNSSCKPFKNFLEAIRKRNIMPLEKAINKITSLPAQLLNIKNRGEIKIGYFADLVIFKDGEIREVLINGQRTIKNGEFQNALSGKFLKAC